MRRNKAEVATSKPSQTESSELYLDENKAPMLHNKNYIVTKQISENKVVSYDASSQAKTFSENNLNGDSSLYNAYKKEMSKFKSLLDGIKGYMDAHPLDSKYIISKVNKYEE